MNKPMTKNIMTGFSSPEIMQRDKAISDYREKILGLRSLTRYGYWNSDTKFFPKGEYFKVEDVFALFGINPVKEA